MVTMGGGCWLVVVVAAAAAHVRRDDGNNGLLRADKTTEEYEYIEELADLSSRPRLDRRERRGKSKRACSGHHCHGPHAYPYGDNYYKPFDSEGDKITSSSDRLLSFFTRTFDPVIQNDDNQCISRLLCEVAGGIGGGGGGGADEGFLRKLLNLQPFTASLLARHGMPSSSLIAFSKAAFIGMASSSKAIDTCQQAYPNCPNDPNQLLDYLNNHKGGIFRRFNAESHKRPHWQEEETPHHQLQEEQKQQQQQQEQQQQFGYWRNYYQNVNYAYPQNYYNPYSYSYYPGYYNYQNYYNQLGGNVYSLDRIVNVQYPLQSPAVENNQNRWKFPEKSRVENVINDSSTISNILKNSFSFPNDDFDRKILRPHHFPKGLNALGSDMGNIYKVIFNNRNPLDVFLNSVTYPLTRTKNANSIAFRDDAKKSTNNIDSEERSNKEEASANLSDIIKSDENEDDERELKEKMPHVFVKSYH